MESRVEKAVQTFESGFGCAQSVFSTYADLFGMDRETALKLASPMGGGIGRMREVCGAVSAMALLAGLKDGNTDPENEEGKERIYAIVREMSDRFKEKNGTIICWEYWKESRAPGRRSGRRNIMRAGLAAEWSPARRRFWKKYC